MFSRRSALSIGIGVASGATLTACSSSSDAQWRLSGSDGSQGSTPAPVRLVFAPTTGATNISPLEPIVVTTEDGILQSVSVTVGDKTVEGALSSDQRTWRSTGVLAYGKTYTIAVSAANKAGTVSQHTSTFDTIKPVSTLNVTFQANALAALKAGGTYGVGQPVIVAFNKPIQDRATAEKMMEVLTEPPVAGRWRWFGNQTVHWRPAKYWAAGTNITVKVNALGVNIGNNIYGAGNFSISFSIGPSRVAVADNKTHRMQVFINGSLARSIPVSLGKGGTGTTSDGKPLHYWTTSGPHVILSKEPMVRMTSASYGVKDPKDPNYYDEQVKLCSRISYSGEYIHLADWNIPAHGQTNTSHGCINVGPAHAQWFYDTFQIGDVVEVTNSPKEFEVTDGIGDWAISWEKW